MISVNGLHIELTNICTLKCPRCARTTFIDKFGTKKFKNKNLKLDHLKSFLHGVNLEKKIISFCGNYGDPIYHKNLIHFVKYFKDAGSTIQITTNGSYQTEKFWKTLVNNLDSNDKIAFSIDGTDKSFTNYRINGDWKSVELGLKIVGASSVDSEWKFIPFSFNENEIEIAKKLAKKFQIKNFFITPSDRWENQSDMLKPLTFKGLREDKISFWKKDIQRKLEVDPKCFNGYEHFITADGYYVPCCYAHDWRFYYKSEWYKEKEKYKLTNTTLANILETKTDFFKNINITKLNYCTFNCPKL